MKKILYILLLCVCMCFVLVGCDVPQAQETETNNNGSIEKIQNSDIFEFVDPDTGVHYWIYSHETAYGGMGGMTPRLNSDGTVMVTE